MMAIAILAALLVGIPMSLLALAGSDNQRPGLLTLLTAAASGVVAVVLARRANQRAAAYNDIEWARLKNEWDKKWLCLRCGDMFMPAPLSETTTAS